MANKKDTDSVKIIDLSEQEKKNARKKTAVVVTYVIALLALWAGLFVPLFGTGGELADRMMFRYLPSIFNSCLFGVLDKNILPDLGEWFLSYNSAHDLFGVDYVAVLCVLYALLCVLGLIFLIPVCCGNRNKRTSAGSAFFIEIASLLVLGGILYFSLQTFVTDGTFDAMNLVISLGVCALIVIIQSIALKGGMGVYKTFTFIIAGIAALALFDIAAIIPALSSPLNNFSDLIQSGNVAGMVNQNGTAIFGFEYLIKFGAFNSEVLELGDLMLKIAVIVIMAFCVLVLFNLAVETISLGDGRKYRPDGTPVTNKGHNVFAIIRYIVTLILGVAAVVLFIVLEGYAPGLYLYIALALTLVELIFAIARTAADKSRVAKGKLPVEDGRTVNLFEDDADFAPVTEDYTPPVVVRDVPPPVAAVPEQSETATTQTAEVIPPIAPVAVNQPAETEQATAPVQATSDEPEQLTMLAPEKKVVYTYKAVYDGPTDAFINTLEDSEKIEFVQTFLEKSKGKFSGMPEYVIGGDNSEFFSSVFIHLNRFRNILSDGLIAKIYKQL